MGEIIRRLALLRTNHRALSCGRHEQKYISDGIYASTRKYRDNRVFVVANKGESACRAMDHTGHPEGCHTCLLSGERFVVDEGAI